jgi:hypothetical protein
MTHTVEPPGVGGVGVGGTGGVDPAVAAVRVDRVRADQLQTAGKSGDGRERGAARSAGGSRA